MVVGYLGSYGVVFLMYGYGFHEFFQGASSELAPDLSDAIENASEHDARLPSRPVRASSRSFPNR